MKTYLLRGVPHSVAMDGWWLQSSEPPRPRPPGTASESPLWPARAGALAALIALADILIWQVTAPGLSLAAFGMAVLLAAWGFAGRQGTAGLIMGAALYLPAVERVQALSIAFLLAGLTLGAAWIASARWPGVGAGARFLLHAPWVGLADLHRVMIQTPGVEIRSGLGAAYRGWLLPLGLGFLFLSLVVSANPMIESWIVAALQGEPFFGIGRLMFWTGVGLLVWPFLSLRVFGRRLATGHAPLRKRTLPSLFNGLSIRRSLILFNAVFAIQTLSDFAVFVGGSLPAGMSYAEYAHRGAYPLLTTALLAGVFALAARPFTTGNPTLRAALLVWMGQTLLLVISSLIRLESYISVYGLTQLRLAALIWMGLVAVGVSLVIGQVLRGQSAGWLLVRCAVLGIATLYVCAFTSLAATIARYNLTHDVVLDADYLCSLDSAAWPVIFHHERATRQRVCDRSFVPRLGTTCDWREWGFRDWRTATSLSASFDWQEPAWPTF